MARFGGGQADLSERFYPASAGDVFAAVQRVIPRRFKLKDSDQFTRSCSFSSGASAFTWGENFTAQVLEADNGALVRIQAVGKVGGQIAQSARSTKLMNELFARVSRELQPKPEDGTPRPDPWLNR